MQADIRKFIYKECKLIALNVFLYCSIIMQLPDANIGTEVNVYQLSKAEFFLGRGLNNCKKKFVLERFGRIAFIGGSITAAPGWRDSVCAYIEREFPHTRFEFINASVGGTNSTFGSARLDEDIFNKGKIDLMFLEFVVNDNMAISSDNNPSLAMEGIIRHARHKNPELDIFVLYFADKSNVQEFKKGERPHTISLHDEVTKYYNITVLNLAKSIAVSVEANDFCWEQFSSDLCHPTAFGHGQYARAITAALQSAWRSKYIDPNDEIVSYKLPMPLNARNYENGHFVEPSKAHIISGWRLVPNWTAEKTCNYSGLVDVLTATESGAKLQLQFEGIGVGIYAIAGMDAGTIEYDIDGKIKGTVQMFDSYCGMFHRPVFRVFDTNLAKGAHKLTLVIGSDRHEKSVGNAVRIVKFAVF